MVNLTIDGKPVSVPEGTTILEAARGAGFMIPSLCYQKDVCDVGACRVCVVEVEGDDMLSASCNMKVTDGMVIHTNSRRVKEARRVNVELALSAHNSDCTACVRNLNCSLQQIVSDLNILESPYTKKVRYDKWPKDYPLIRDSSKCIACMRCMMVCEKIQSLGVWDTRGSAVHLTLGLPGNKTINESECALCGQCIVHCPVGALYARPDTQKVFDAIHDPEKVVVVQIAPAVRAAWNEGVGLNREEAGVGKLVAAVRALGVDYVFDTNFTADLTVMEEGSELLARLADKGSHAWPMFTSCCPGWVRFLKSQYPELTPNLSTAKSPQQMFGAVTKSWFAQRTGIDPAKIFSVSIMPCLAKKNEATLPGMDSAGSGQDVDAVITTRELVSMLKTFMINIEALKEERFDDLLGEGTGAAVIFGSMGGVMQAALRSVHCLVTGQNPDPDAFTAIRGFEGWKETSISLDGKKVRAAVASGLSNARELVEKVKSGEVKYDFVEIMACPGGCVCGGGQPITDGAEFAPERAPVLYDLDKGAKTRFSHENPSIKKAYDEFFEKPLSHRSHELLHTDHTAWTMPPHSNT
ncbi:MAG: [FeFe] hydrogenase, group A [Oscillospiraceae bacterium]|nr:[FeFe] hydrogenase, group A [Oscillospiraceae bacterium]